MKLKYLIALYLILLTSITLATPAEESIAELRIAVIIEMPYAYYDSTKTLTGYNIDFAKALAAKLNWQADFFVCPIARCFALMKNGHADMIIDINKTSERETYLSYLPPYKNQVAPLRFFTLNKENINIKNQSDLATLNIGAIRGTSFSAKLATDKSIQLVLLNTHSQLIKMLLFGRIDAFIEREEILIGLSDYQQYRDEFTISSWHYSHETPSYLAVSKKSPLNNQLNLIIEKLDELKRDGTIERIFKSSEVK